MSLLNQRGNNKGKKKDGKKQNASGTAKGSKFIPKQPAGGFVSKQANTGSQRGS